MNEQQFRALCRTENGGIEAEAFQDALDKEPATDTIPVVFDEKTVLLPRQLCEQYARWAKEERQPEADLTEQIKPQMRNWILMNRKSMCKRLRISLEKYHPSMGGVTIVWETASPDKCSYDVVKRYLEAYG